jgi:hypothetical protein
MELAITEPDAISYMTISAERAEVAISEPDAIPVTIEQQDEIVVSISAHG